MATESQRIASYAKGAVVYLQSERCCTLDLIIEGSVLVQSIDEQGNALTVSEFGSGDLIGLNLLFSQRNFYPMTITAKTALVMLKLQKATILELCGHNNCFLSLLLENLSDRSLYLADKIKLMSAKSIRQLIVDFLTYEYIRQDNQRIELPLSKKELAERFGIPRTSLSRELQKMRRAGLIEYGRSHILVKDLELIHV